MYIALSSVHALILCGLQFISCVRGQWTGKFRLCATFLELRGEAGKALKGRTDFPVLKEILTVSLGVNFFFFKEKNVGKI